METETKKIDKRVWIVVILLLVFTVGALIFSNLGSMNVPKTSENDRGLQAILANERENILAALTDNLTFYNPDLFYNVEEVYLLSEKYAVVLLESSSVTYRALLSSNDAWQAVSYPRIVLSYGDFSDVPVEIIKAANIVGRDK